MEHACDKCGAAVEDGVPFCQQCNAPQIRVGESLAPGVNIPGFPTQAETYASTSAIQWSQALPSAALAGLIAAVLMFIPLGAFGLGMIAAGVLAVLFYRRRNPVGNLSPGMGARLGAVGGTLGFGIFAIFTAIEVLVFHSGGQLRAALLEAIQQSAARTSDPQAQQILDYLKSPPGLALVMGLGLAVMFVVFLIFSSLGGALAAALLRRKHRL
ncbi:MAG TPA: zinc ribbon domain-containing protein [Terriglobales bacterium]|nr:zinc ribbon domain-containing protein [Terriglobales bacterium]